jgi:hypothetical protein
MDRLPPEILDNLVQQLPVGDVKSLRLTCKALACIGADHLLSELILTCHPDHQLKRLPDVASHPVLSRKIQSIHFETDALHKGKKSRKEWERTFSDRRVLLASLRHLGDPNDDFPIMTRQQMREHYKVYTSTYDRQEEMFDQELDWAAWQLSLKTLPNLEELTLSVFNVWRHLIRERYRDPFKDTLEHASTDYENEPQGVRQMSCVLNALAKSNVRLKTLRAGSVWWTFLNQDVEERQDTQKVVKSLQKLKFEITASNEDKEDYLPDEFEWVQPECREFLRTDSALRDLLAAAADLQHLSLIFDYDRLDRNERAIMATSLLHFIPHTIVWPRLTHLTLGCFDAAEDDLVELLSRHKATLNYLQLRDIKLMPGSWRKFLPKLRPILKLKWAYMCGYLLGSDYGGELLEGWYMPPPETWDFDDEEEEEEEEGRAVTRYLREGGEFPFPDDREI